MKIRRLLLVLPALMLLAMLRPELPSGHGVSARDAGSDRVLSVGVAPTR